MVSLGRICINPSLESAPADGKVRKEKESVWYVKGIDMAALEKAATSNELQEQYSIQGVNGQVRVRRIDGKECIQTTKSWNGGEAGKDECEIEVPEAMFDMFANICPSGMIKRRYCIPVEGGEQNEEGHDPVLEVDIYFEGHDPANAPAPWCKIDYEYGALPEGYEWPFGFEEINADTPHDRTPEQKAFIDDIMDKYLIKKNGA